MHEDLKNISRKLANHALSVCETYLSNGKREGHYWKVGDVLNTPGRSLYVRLVPGRNNAAGRWTDAATGEGGDLLDLIQANQQYANVIQAKQEALRFLSEPELKPDPPAPAKRDSALSAQRLFHASRQLHGTHGASYLRARGITCSLHLDALRFHPGCYHRAYKGAQLENHPAIVAAVTDLSGHITGALRIYLDANHPRKASFEEPRRAMGQVNGHAVRFGSPGDVLVAGEGIETMLALRSLLPHLPMAAATSASHLGALLLPSTLKRLYIATDNDPAGRIAAERLIFRHIDTELQILQLVPQLDDWNTDLIRFGPAYCAPLLLPQLLPVDRLPHLELEDVPFRPSRPGT